jgi:hypothetical protein
VVCAGELLKRGNSTYQVACAAGAGAGGSTAPRSGAHSQHSGLSGSRQTAFRPQTPDTSSLY